MPRGLLKAYLFFYRVIVKKILFLEIEKRGQEENGRRGGKDEMNKKIGYTLKTIVF